MARKRNEQKDPRRKERNLSKSSHFDSDLGSNRLIHQGAASAPFLSWPGLWDLVLDELPLNGPLAGEKGL